MASFDAIATTFDQFRALPPGVPEAIRTAVWHAVGAPAGARVLDLGAGTGRIGKAFVEEGDNYVGADLSFAMLREFLVPGHTLFLTQTDGERLPFREGTFHVVLLMQVLSGARNVRRLLAEAGRMLAPGGALIVGQTVAPSDGVDAQMKSRLAEILASLGVERRAQRLGQVEALEWFASRARRRASVVAARWISGRSPRGFLARHRTGSRFAALPEKIQHDAIEQLAAWAERHFGSLDAAFSESYSFELEVFEL
jgi:ubiquinone/menaquinone biosynthesis C-methylase UbiE